MTFRESLVNHCTGMYGWTLPESKANVDGFFQFMEIKKRAVDKTATKVSPSPIIDQVWHVALLFTQQYAAFCESDIGFFVHHRPDGATEGAAKESRYRDTHMAHLLLFGEPDARMWPMVDHKDQEHAGWVRKLPSYRATLDSMAATAAAASAATAATSSAAATAAAAAAPPLLEKRLKKAEKAEKAEKAAERVHVNIRELTGKLFPLQCESNDTITNVMQKIQQRAGIPVDQQRLIFNGKRLEEKRTIADYCVESGSILHLVFRLGGC